MNAAGRFDERRIVATTTMQQAGTWSLEDDMFLGWAEADIVRPEWLFSKEILR